MNNGLTAKRNVLIMAGTHDAARIIKKLKECGIFNILATTTTSYGAEIAKSYGADETLSGPLDENNLNDLIKEKEIDVLIDATHPFAVIATKNAIKASEIAGIGYIRFERPKEVEIENINIHKVSSFNEASSKILEIAGSECNILHLAGVSTLPGIVKNIDVNRIFVRVLPSIDSIQKCLDLGLKQENIIAMQGTFSKDLNKYIMKDYNISIILTKESGETGGTSSKINAAHELGIPIVIVLRPEVLELKNKTVFYNVDDLYNFLC